MSLSCSEQSENYCQPPSSPRNSTLKKYKTHKANSRRRGIDFYFSFDEWVNWWFDKLGPDWESLRGCSRGKYCMARIGDTGPYSPENVKCIPFSENLREMVDNGTCARGEARNRSSLTPESVAEIFLSVEKAAVLAKKFGISQGTICDIRSRRSWNHVTDVLKRTSLRGRNQWL